VNQRRVALVTGASRGLGAAIAQSLAAQGFAVAVNYWDNEAEGEGVVGRIQAAGGHAAAFGADATDDADVTRLVAEVSSTLGAVDVLVVNATGPQPEIALTDLTWADVAAQLDYFVRSPLLLTQAVVPGMRQRRWGRIVHIGSDATDRALPTLPAYVTAKAAQLGLAAVSARTLGQWGITVNTVAPGWIPVERHADIGPEDREAYVSQVPLGRMGTPGDIAGAVAFLASDDSSFITGQRIVVNGGHGHT
jgi:NAD(P)-dependent dehydrogenase (short-subunit alcohol dehydrogenase family)